MKVLVLAGFVLLTFGGLQSQQDLQSTDACQCLSDEVLSEVMGWDESSIIKSDETFGRSRSLCMIKGSNSDVVYIRLGWNSDKAQENKVLSKKFANYLAKGEDGIIYEKIEDADATEAIIGNQSMQGELSMSIARKRYDEKAEVQVEISGEGEAKVLSKKVRSMLENIK